MSDVIFVVILVALIGVSALCAGIVNGMYSLNHYQLKRKAQLGDRDAKIVYPIKSLNFQLLVTLLIINITSNASIAILLDSKTSGVLAVVLSTIFILTFGEIIPMIYMRKYVVYVTARIAPVLNKIILFMKPVAKPISKLLDKWIGDDTQIFYSKEQLIRMFDGQKLSENSDIDRDETRMLRQVLEFGDKRVRDVMTPKRVVTSVSAEDDIGPILVDELHKSGHSRFPVYNDKKALNFVGTLFLYDLVDLQSQKGRVKDLMRKEVYYVHEEKPLDFALNTFLKTNHHLLVVVNSFEEVVGVLALEDVIEQIIGRQIVDEFDQHADMRAVAKSLAKKELKERALTEKK